MIWLYAFADGRPTLPARGGVGGAQLAGKHFEDVTAVVSRGAVPATMRKEDVIAHGLVVEELAASAVAMLPVRFGESFAEERTLEDAVRPRLDSLRQALDLVRGCVELGVRVQVQERSVEEVASGGDYLRARLESTRPATELARRLELLVRASVDGGPGDTAYLVERSEVGALRETVDRFAATHPDVSVVCTGPWAPYSFAGGAGA
jgi:hypothetical protein